MDEEKNEKFTEPLLFCCSRIYLYNVLQLEKGPVKSFSGCFIESFFIKVSCFWAHVLVVPLANCWSSLIHVLTSMRQLQSALSPDASHILGGSSDGNAYIWQVWYLSKRSFIWICFCIGMNLISCVNQVNKPQADPITMKGHNGEVTAVDWYIFFSQAYFKFPSHKHVRKFPKPIFLFFAGANLRLGK